MIGSKRYLVRIFLKALSLTFVTRFIFINNTPSFSYVPRIEYERAHVERDLDSKPVYIEAKYNFVDEDESSPSLFWKLNDYYQSKYSLPFNGTENQVWLIQS